MKLNLFNDTSRTITIRNLKQELKNPQIAEADHDRFGLGIRCEQDWLSNQREKYDLPQFCEHYKSKTIRGSILKHKPKVLQIHRLQLIRV